MCWVDGGGDGEWSKEQQQPVAYHNNGGVIVNRLFPTRVMCKAVKHYCKKKVDKKEWEMCL